MDEIIYRGDSRFIFLIKLYQGSRIKDEMSAGCGRCREKTEMHTEFWEKPEEQRPLGRFRLGWEGNIKMNLKEIGWEEVGYIRLAQDTEE